MQSAAKRYKLTGSGKVMVRRAGKQHLNEKQSRKTKRNLRCGSEPTSGGVQLCSSTEGPSSVPSSKTERNLCCVRRVWRGQQQARGLVRRRAVLAARRSGVLRAARARRQQRRVF